jgi:hypothetical protein
MQCTAVLGMAIALPFCDTTLQQHCCDGSREVLGNVSSTVRWMWACLLPDRL